jgi:hypothetical protein
MSTILAASPARGEADGTAPYRSGAEAGRERQRAQDRNRVASVTNWAFAMPYTGYVEYRVCGNRA